MRSPKDQTMPRITRRDPTAAAKLLDGFMSLGRGPDLAALAAEPGANTGALADDIVAAWYCLQPWGYVEAGLTRPAPRMSASSACSAPRKFSMVRAPRAPAISSERRAWATIRSVRW